MGHCLSDCLSINSYQKCNGRQHTLLYRTEKETGIVPLSSRSNVGHISTIKSTLFMTATTHIVGNDRSEEVRVLFDPGSQISLVTSTVVKCHKLRVIPAEMSISGVADMECPIKKCFQHSIRLQTRTGKSVLIEAFEVNHLADSVDLTGKIQILIGANMILTSVPDRIGKKDESFAKHTKLGWVISGNVAFPDISNFWKLEEIGTSNKKYISKNELKVEEVFRCKVRMTDNGHIEDPLPLMDDFLDMSESKETPSQTFQ
ncbi:unnamed protein product [Lepeophtheirus salmonis]|uniref:(salmon louse) hypothetical protein n=1 Tax=Lepeophtheirus salmonis TaxID=72036 RepID=A0A7R8CSQ7_LEPSM|nr:unnamed protein product [Lepeophtheirus salmonis]CAF2919124.1 unnamed protein product [Lepeophtheirus salmonis]